MLRRGLDRGEVARRGEQRQFIRRRDMQHMQAAAGGACQPQHALGGSTRRFHVAPHRMRARIALARARSLRAFSRVFVFGMHGHAAAAGFQRGENVCPPGSSSSVPVEEPRNAFTPHTPGMRSSSASAPTLAGVAPT